MPIGRLMNSIRSTFQHLHGIGEKREAELWANGFKDWRDLRSGIPEQLELYKGEPSPIDSEIKQSEEALKAEDFHFFAERLPKRELHRVATSFPDKCVFLDIETTGLSSYYDTVTLIGWSVGGEYFAEVAPADISKLITVLDQNQIVVTFNGSLFDLPFLSKHFSIDWSKYIHIDLRYLAKRVDLSGGQKKIELELNLLRDNSVNDVDGAEAVALWFDYKEGSLEALRRLIRYNHADVEGMKRIFEEAISRLYSLAAEDRLAKISKVFPRSRIVFDDAAKIKCSASRVEVKPFSGICGPRLILTDLIRSQPKIEDVKVVGIDLTGSEKRASGWAVVHGAQMDCALISSDSDLIESTLSAKPSLVSIDSPLSLPQGRLSEFDDDPGRGKFGIIRVAERKLRERGISSYPALLPSMQKLTARGIDLAASLRRCGIPVIESYPGAAQDILGIPRKQKGLRHLKRGLSRFGYSSLESHNDISHDELDALTSALVGQFMLAGFSEEVGSDEEDYMIVPTIEAHAEFGKLETVVGISGALSSGKTTAARVLESQGFKYCRFSQFLAYELERQNRPATRDNLQVFGAEVRNSRFGQRMLHLAIAAETRGAKKIVVDGLRHPEDHAFLFERWGFKSVHLHIEAKESARRDRLIARNRAGDLDFADIDSHEVEDNCSLLRDLADQVVPNDQSLRVFKNQITQIVESRNAN